MSELSRCVRVRSSLAAGCAALVAGASGVHAQSTAPSSITPPTLRPAPQAPDTAPAIPQAERLVAPAGAEALTVTLDAVAVEGGFPELAEESTRVTAPLLHHPVSLAQLYAMASAIEAAYARHGFVLARVVVPPQQLAGGGTFRIVVIDGFIDSVDVSAVPAPVRAQVALRAGRLIGQRHLRIGAIEQPLLLAGDVPGLSLTSTLARGNQPGAARLVLSGRHAVVSGSVSADNTLAASLGRYEAVAQVSFNSAFGLGEQIYGFAVGGYDLPKAFRSDAPVRVLGGGVIVAPGSRRLSINPEATFSRTQPAPQPGVPQTRGTLQRLSMRGGFIVQKTRRRTIAVSAVVEHIEEANDALDFAVRLSLDRFVAARVGLSYSAVLPRGGISASAQLSQGFGGLRAGDLPAGVLPSRTGAAPDFTKASLAVRYARAVGHGLQLGLSATGQSSFGQPLFRSEQTALEGADALSAYFGGTTAVDSAVIGRAELSRAVAIDRAPVPIRLTPYAFTAAGQGWIARPTAVEAGQFAAFNLGVGLRGVLAGTRLGFAVEYAHGFSPDARFDRVDRVAASTTVRF